MCFRGDALCVTCVRVQCEPASPRLRRRYASVSESPKRLCPAPAARLSPRDLPSSSRASFFSLIGLRRRAIGRRGERGAGPSPAAVPRFTYSGQEVINCGTSKPRRGKHSTLGWVPPGNHPLPVLQTPTGAHTLPPHDPGRGGERGLFPKVRPRQGAASGLCELRALAGPWRV